MACFIFDFDGTLVNSEPLHKEAVAKILERFGQAFREESYMKGLGRGSKAVLKAALEDAGIAVSEEELEALVKEKEAIFLKLAEELLEEVEGATEFIKTLKGRGHKVGIATGYYKAYIERLAHRLPFLNYVDALVTTEGLRPKPHPDVYEKAKSLLGCEEGYAFEDSPAGIRAALRANLKVSAIASTLPKAFYYACFDNLLGVFDNFREVKAFFEEKGLL